MSFHHDLEKWLRWCDPKHCLVCQNEEPPSDLVTIREGAFSWLEAHPRVCLPETCHVLSKAHAIELDDLSDEDLFGFMKDVQLAARALKDVTGATKINYEIHGNTVPHLHLHLFPRTPDDPFPGQPIDYNRIEPPVYQGGEFDAFITAMRNWFAELEEGQTD